MKHKNWHFPIMINLMQLFGSFVEVMINNVAETESHKHKHTFPYTDKLKIRHDVMQW